MRHTVTLIVALLVTFTCSTAAQIPGYPNGCAKCMVFGYVDAPADPAVVVAVPVVSGEWMVAGWGFECESGRAVDRVDVWYSDADGFFKPVPWQRTRLVTGIARPDVVQAYQGYCQRVEGSTGYGLMIDAGAIPPGTRMIVINAWRGPYYHQSRRVVLVA